MRENIKNRSLVCGFWLNSNSERPPEAYEYLTKLVKEAGVEGFHFDENCPADWIKTEVVDKLGVPACTITDGAAIAKGPVEKIDEAVKNDMASIR